MQAIARLGAEGCTPESTLCAFSNADSITGGSWPSFDDSGATVQRLAPYTFTEIGVSDFTGVRFATLMRRLCEENGGAFVGLNYTDP